MDVVLTAISDCILRKLGILAISWPSQVLPERQAWSPANAEFTLASFGDANFTYGFMTGCRHTMLFHCTKNRAHGIAS